MRCGGCPKNLSGLAVGEVSLGVDKTSRFFTSVDHLCHSDWWKRGVEGKTRSLCFHEYVRAESLKGPG